MKNTNTTCLVCGNPAKKIHCNCIGCGAKIAIAIHPECGEPALCDRCNKKEQGDTTVVDVLGF